MLSKIREKATGFIAYAIVILISIPFALWGINSYFEGQGQAVVATVEGVEVDLNTFQQALAERRRLVTQVLQNNPGSDYFESAAFKNQVLEGLIQNAAQSSWSQETGYRVSDEVLGQQIRQLPYFQTDGNFDQQRYQDLVANAGMSVARFEQQQRQQLISEQIESAFTDSAFVARADVDRALVLLEQTRTADYAVLSSSNPDIEVNVDEDEIRSFYEQNQGSFFAPEQMQVNYVVLSVDKIAEGVEIDEEEARRYYDDNPGRFGRPEERRVSHILIELPADAGEEAVDAAREEAAALVEQARGGADFAELAKMHSDDSGSAANGGDLGVLSSGAMVKPFEDAAFALESAGDVSEPVRSRFGFHVIKLTELREPSISPFEEVREVIEAQLRRQLAESQYLESVETFSNIVYEQPESLAPAADDLGLEIESTDWFSAGQGDGVAANPRFRTIAFSDEVRIDGLNSEAFEIDADTTVAVHRIDVRERRLQSLDEVRDEILATLESRARADAVKAEGESLVAELNAGKAWSELVEAHRLDSAEFIGTRQEGFDTVSRELAQEIFSLDAPGEGEIVSGGFATSDGNYVIYRLTDVTDGDPAQVSEARREEVRAVLRSRHADGVYLGFQQALRDGAQVQVFEDQLAEDSLFSQ